MIRLHHSFTHQNLTEYNDEVYPGPAFPLAERIYTFHLTPTNLTEFWRFGIVLCKTEDAEFMPSEGRYNNKELKFIQIYQADLNDKQVANTHKLEIQTYYFKEYEGTNGILKTFLNQSLGDTVEISMQLSSNEEQLLVNFSSGDNVFAHTFNINNYPYFKIAAWADTMAFTLEMMMDIKLNMTYNFIKQSLSNTGKRFLRLLNENFKNGITYNDVNQIPGFAAIFPGQFNTDDFKYLIAGDRDITLFGIWQIEATAKIFRMFDEVVFAIQQILLVQRSINQVTSKTLMEMIPQISLPEIKQVFQQMGFYPNFMDGGGSSGEIIHINISSKATFDNYRTYRGLQKYLTDYLNKSDVLTNTINTDDDFSDEKISADDNIDIEDYATIEEIGDTPQVSKTPFLRQRLLDIEPVLGVKELASDVAQLIHGMQDDSGQMIGIFGRWGKRQNFFY